MIQIMLAFKHTQINCSVLPEHLIRTSEQASIPDGAFTLEKEEKRALFLLEFCAGTEIVKSPTFNQDIEAKFITYTDLFENNAIQFYENYFETGFNRFRLFIANSFQRMETISQIAAEHDPHGFIHITTLNDVKRKGIYSDIWYIPIHDKFKSII